MRRRSLTIEAMAKMLEERQRDTWTFWVPGVAQPQGSMRTFRHPKTGASITTSDNPKLRPWRKAVALAAMAEGVRLLDGPVAFLMGVYLPRPKNHFGRHGLLPRFAAARPTGRPDLDKLQRGLFDALQGVAYASDAQVVSCSAQKFYADEKGPGVQLTVCAILPPGDLLP